MTDTGKLYDASSFMNEAADALKAAYDRTPPAWVSEMIASLEEWQDRLSDIYDNAPETAFDKACRYVDDRHSEGLAA